MSPPVPLIAPLRNRFVLVLGLRRESPDARKAPERPWWSLGDGELVFEATSQRDFQLVGLTISAGTPTRKLRRRGGSPVARTCALAWSAWHARPGVLHEILIADDSPESLLAVDQPIDASFFDPRAFGVAVTSRPHNRGSTLRVRLSRCSPSVSVVALVETL